MHFHIPAWTSVQAVPNTQTTLVANITVIDYQERRVAREGNIHDHGFARNECFKLNVTICRIPQNGPTVMSAGCQESTVRRKGQRVYGRRKKDVSRPMAP